MKSSRYLSGFFLIAALWMFQSTGWGYSVAYHQAITVEGAPLATSKIVAKNQKLRSENNIGGMTIVELRNESGVYNYFPAQKVAQKIPDSLRQPHLAEELPHFMESLLKNNGKKVGSEVYDGKETDIYTYDEPTLQKEAKVWVWKEKEFPLKVEVQSPEGNMVILLSNVDFAPKADDALFQVPPGTKIVDANQQAEPVPPAGIPS